MIVAGMIEVGGDGEARLGAAAEAEDLTPGFDPSDAVEFWDMVNRQDWGVCELTQLGVGAKGYVAGRYSAEESDVHAFDTLVAERYMEALGGEAG